MASGLKQPANVGNRRSGPPLAAWWSPMGGVAGDVHHVAGVAGGCVFTWIPDAFDLGIQTVEAAPGEPVRVHSPTRTVVDLMRLRGRIGESVAHIALRRYLGRPDARVGQLIDLARALDVLGPVRAAVDVLTAW